MHLSKWGAGVSKILVTSKLQIIEANVRVSKFSDALHKKYENKKKILKYTLFKALEQEINLTYFATILSNFLIIARPGVPMCAIRAFSASSRNEAPRTTAWRTLI